jgi:hypothetical protein
MVFHPANGTLFESNLVTEPLSQIFLVTLYKIGILSRDFTEMTATINQTRKCVNDIRIASFSRLSLTNLLKCRLDYCATAGWFVPLSQTRPVVSWTEQSTAPKLPRSIPNAVF